MTRSCGDSALLVGGERRLLEDPCEYNTRYSRGPGCNNIRCDSCGEKIRYGPPGVRLDGDGRTPADMPAMYATSDWTTLPFVIMGSASWRLYICKCKCWQETTEALLVNDQDSPSDPNLPWRCGGHVAPSLPVSLGTLTIGEDTDWPALVQRILSGECPRRLEHKDQGPTEWLDWLYEYLSELPAAENLAMAVSERISDPDDDVVSAVLQFFVWHTTATGISTILQRAEAVLPSVFVGHGARPTMYAPRFWDTLIAMMLRRRNLSSEISHRVIALVRKAMLLPCKAEFDPVKASLEDRHSNAFQEADLLWMSENIAAIESASAGRWSAILNRLLRAKREDSSREYLLAIAGVAIIQSKVIDKDEIQAWVRGHSDETDGWALVMSSALEDRT